MCVMYIHRCIVLTCTYASVYVHTYVRLNNNNVCIILRTQNITKHPTPNFQGFTNLCKAHTVMKVAANINETQRLYEASIRIQVDIRT